MPKSPENKNKVPRFRETPDVIERIESESTTKKSLSKPPTPSIYSGDVSNFSLSTLTSSLASKHGIPRPMRLRYNQLFNDSGSK